MPRIRKRNPRKRNNRKRNFRKRANRRVKRGVGNFTHLGHNLTLPKSMLIKQDFQFSGYIPNGVTGSGFFDIVLNSGFKPLDPAAGNYTTSSESTSFIDANNRTGVMLSGSSIDNTSQDYSKIITIYQQSRVLKSKLSVTAIPALLSDAIQLFVTPYCVSLDGESALGSGELPLNDSSQSMAPRCKSKICVANVASQSRNTLHYSTTVASLIGLSKRNIMDDPNYIESFDETATDPKALRTQLNWRVFWLTTDGANLSAKLPIHVKLTNITKFSTTENKYIG